MYRRWDLIKTSASAGWADRNRLQPSIKVPEGWSRNSYAEELMGFRSKKTGWEWGVNAFERPFYAFYAETAAREGPLRSLVQTLDCE